MLRRDCAAKVDALLAIFPAVLILGARQSGKTTLANQVRGNCLSWTSDADRAQLIDRGEPVGHDDDQPVCSSCDLRDILEKHPHFSVWKDLKRWSYNSSIMASKRKCYESFDQECT